MSVPDYQAIMLPLLRCAAAAGLPVSMIKLLPDLAKQFNLTPAEIAERMPSGNAGVFYNRAAWAKTYLTRAGLLASTQRGLFEITAEGQRLLKQNPKVVDNALLARYPAFVAWKSRSPETAIFTEPTAKITVETVLATPEERIEAARKELEINLQADVLDRVRQMDPAAFEELIIQLLVRMGYGQGREEMARALGGPGDGGVDGVVNQDQLGLDRVYIQAKRYKSGNTVGPSDINNFIGALNIKKANKGLFVTASTFTKQAKEHALSSSLHVVLIDGDRLAELLVRHNVGVSVRQTVEIKVIDETFFAG